VSRTFTQAETATNNGNGSMTTINWGCYHALDDRTYYQIEPRLAWQLTRQLFLYISYRYRRSEREVSGVADVADSNAIILGLVYNFEK
jgi:hypothetical protein